MAYLDAEFRNFRLIWTAIAPRVVVIGLIVAGMVAASIVATYLGYVPTEATPQP